MATTYDKASLVMIPSGVKESKLYSIKPTDGSGDFTFSRGTDTATRVNASGLIEKERSNQLTYSNDFSNAAWSKTRSTITGGQSGYDGSSDASLLESTATASSGYVFQNFVSSGVHNRSVYAKAGTSNWLGLYTTGSENVFFDLANGQLGSSTSDIIDAKIEAVGATGWYRCSFSINAEDNHYIFIANGDNDVNTNSGDNIYIQDAMINEGLVAQPYIETTTAAVYEGITDNLPRLDYSGGASCPSLLLEPSRTNLITQSEYFGSQTINDATLTNNYAASPEGVLNATRLNQSGTDYGNIQFDAISYSNGVDYTHSIFVKKDSKDYIIFREFASSSVGGVRTSWFDLDALAWETSPSAHTTDFEDYGNGWIRLIVTFNAGNTFSRVHQWGHGDADNSLVVANSGSTLFYGNQVESSASYPTSYIPTYGTSASRAQEGGQVTSVSDLIGQTEGTLYAEVDSFGVGEAANRIIGVSDGTSSERVIIITRSTGYRFIMSNGAVNNPDYSKTMSTDGIHKLAMTYDANEVRIFVDGVKVHTDSSVTLPSSLNSVHIGKAEQNGNYGNNFGGSAKQGLVFKTALTDAECIALTTI